MRPATRLIHAPDAALDPHAATSHPIYQTATFRQGRADAFDAYDYSRSGNPTRDALEAALADLDGAAHALAFASGMAAVTALMHLVGRGESVLVGEDVYGGTYRLLERVLAVQGVEVRSVDACATGAVAAALGRPGPAPRVLLVETPTNPRLRICDVAALADLAHARGTLLAVDNTMLSPWLQKPLALGADIAIQSATKHLGGHGDVTAGVLAVNDEGLAEKLAFVRNATGTALPPFDSWLLLRGLKTLAVRLERQQATAGHLAGRLAAHPAVHRVHFPGAPGHPGREVHARQARGSGCVIAFETGERAISQRLVEDTRLFSITVSFGSVGSSISLPACMSHASIPAAVRSSRALPDDLVRLSVGLEEAADLEEDLLGALELAAAGFSARRSPRPLEEPSVVPSALAYHAPSP